jgi:transmembrane protein EpsG
MNNFESLLFYLFTFSASALLYFYAEKRNSKFFITISLLIPILVGGLRYGVGTDFFIYSSIFNDAIGQSMAEYLTEGPTEIGFYILSVASHIITNDETLLFQLFSTITVLFFYFGLRKYKIKHKPIVYFLFLLTIFPGSFNIMRQIAAASICFYAFTFILDKRILKFIYWIIIATAMHTSALITAPLYLMSLYSTKIRKGIRASSFTNLVKSLIPSLILLITLPSLFILINTVDLFGRYVSYEDVDLYGANNTFYLKLLILIGLFIVVKQIVKTRIDLALLSLTSVDVVLSILGFIAAPIKRIAMYFSVFPLLLLPKYIDIFSDRFGKFTSYSLIVAYGVIFFIISFYVLGQADILPYRTIFNKEL